jgi:hypothetical protein
VRRRLLVQTAAAVPGEHRLQDRGEVQAGELRQRRDAVEVRREPVLHPGDEARRPMRPATTHPRGAGRRGAPEAGARPCSTAARPRPRSRTPSSRAAVTRPGSASARCDSRRTSAPRPLAAAARTAPASASHATDSSVSIWSAKWSSSSASSTGAARKMRLSRPCPASSAATTYEDSASGCGCANAAPRPLRRRKRPPPPCRRCAMRSGYASARSIPAASLLPPPAATAGAARELPRLLGDAAHGVAVHAPRPRRCAAATQRLHAKTHVGIGGRAVVGPKGVAVGQERRQLARQAARAPAPPHAAPCARGADGAPSRPFAARAR